LLSAFPGLCLESTYRVGGSGSRMNHAGGIGVADADLDDVLASSRIPATVKNRVARPAIGGRCVEHLIQALARGDVHALSDRGLPVRNPTGAGGVPLAWGLSSLLPLQDKPNSIIRDSGCIRTPHF